MDDFENNINLIINRNHLETITENQNSPYSTQASQCTTRRMSAQSIFSDVARRGSLPFTAPVMELFHENDLEGKFVDKNKSLPTDIPLNPEQHTDYAVCIAKQGVQNKTKEMTETNTESEADEEGTEISDRKDEISGDPENTELQSPVLRNIVENKHAVSIRSPSPTVLLV